MVMSIDRRQSEGKFADIWAERHRIQPEIASDWVNNNWAKGRNQLLPFHIRIRDRKVTRKIAEIQDKLSNILCVDPLAKDYLHISQTQEALFDKWASKCINTFEKPPHSNIHTHHNNHINDEWEPYIQEA